LIQQQKKARGFISEIARFLSFNNYSGKIMKRKKVFINSTLLYDYDSNKKLAV